MKLSNAKFFLAACSLVLLSSCSETKPTLIGQWSGLDTRGNHQTMVFHEDDSLTWIIAGMGTLKVEYRFDPSTMPAQLDLIGFESPPLAGKSLYGIVEFEGANSIRFDCDAGGAMEPGENYRPTDFTKDTVTYARQ